MKKLIISLLVIAFAALSGLAMSMQGAGSAPAPGSYGGEPDGSYCGPHQMCADPYIVNG